MGRKMFWNRSWKCLEGINSEFSFRIVQFPMKKRKTWLRLERESWRMSWIRMISTFLSPMISSEDSRHLSRWILAIRLFLPRGCPTALNKRRFSQLRSTYYKRSMRNSNLLALILRRAARIISSWKNHFSKDTRSDIVEIPRRWRRVKLNSLLKVREVSSANPWKSITGCKQTISKLICHRTPRLRNELIWKDSFKHASFKPM